MLCLTYIYWHIEQQELTEKRQKAFTAAADQTKSHVALRLSRYALVLNGVKGFYESSHLFKQNEYQSYIEALQLQQHLPGLQLVGLVTYVSHDKRAQHYAAMQHSASVTTTASSPAVSALLTHLSR